MKRWLLRRVIDRIGAANIVCAVASWTLFWSAMSYVLIERSEAVVEVLCVLFAAAAVLAVISAW